MDSAIKQSDYPKEVFFLGAGASALAGVPTFANFDEKAEDISKNNLVSQQFGEVLEYWKKNFDKCNIEEFYEAVEMRETLANPTDKEKRATVTTDDIENFIYYTIQKSIKSKFLFSWDEIPGSHEEKLRDFLSTVADVWIKTARIEKNDDENTIKVSAEGNHILLILKEQTNLWLRRFENNQICYESYDFIVKMENGTRKIYKWNTNVHELYEKFLDLIEHSVIITTNWDTVLETSHRRISIENGGISYECIQPYDEIKSRIHRQYRVLKLHGSLNWGFCKTCGNIYYFNEKIHDLAPIEGEACNNDKCSGNLTRVIVPPKLSKLSKPEQNNSELNNESNPKSLYFHLSSIWSKASEYFKNCEKVYFIGYSFPETDVQMKTFFSNALRENSNLNELKIIIVSSQKHGYSRVEFEERYLSILSRFISQSRIEFHYDGFEEIIKIISSNRNYNSPNSP